MWFHPGSLSRLNKKNFLLLNHSRDPSDLVWTTLGLRKQAKYEKKIRLRDHVGILAIRFLNSKCTQLDLLET